MTSTYIINDTMLVNDFPQDSQFSSSVTKLTGGGWVVTWSSADSLFNEIHARVYDENGNPLTQDLTISQDDLQPANDPVVTALKDGTWIVAWQGTDADGAGIHYQHFDSIGTPLGQPSQYANELDFAHDQTKPSITGLADGGWVVSWQSQSVDGSNWDIFHQVFDSTGQPVDEVQVNTTANGSHTSPVITALPDGSWVEVWAYVNGTYSGILQKHYAADGSVLQGETVVLNQSTSASRMTIPSVAVTSDGGWVMSGVIDNTTDMVYALRFSSSGTYQASASISTSSSIESSAIAGLSDGNFVIAWSQNDAGLIHSYVQVFNQFGIAVGGRIALLDGGVCSDVSVTAVADGSFVVSYSAEDGSGTGIFQQLIELNQSPVTADNTVSLNEDASYTFQSSDFSFSDADNDSFAYVKITDLPDSGSLKLNNVAVTMGQEIAVSDIGNLVWTPDADDNGSSADALKFKVKDSAGNLSDEHAVTFNVTAQPDAPTAADNTISISEDSSHTFVASDFGFSDVDSDTLASVTITALPADGSLTLDGTPVTVNQEITAADIANLKWTPAADANGAGLGEFTFTVKDSTGQESVASHTIKFDVAAVADDPVSADKTVTVDEDSTYTFSLDDFAFSDADGDALRLIHVTEVPQDGKLLFNGVQITAGFYFDPEDSQLLVWKPAANTHGDGLASLKFQMQDMTFAESAEKTITFNVSSVPDAPTGSNKAIPIDEDTSYTFAASDFGFSDADGDTLASVTIGTLPSSGTLKLNDVVVTANQEIAAADLGNLVWTPAADDNGLREFTFTVKDSSGQESTFSNTIRFSIAAVPDDPVSADKTVTLDEDTSYTFQSSDFAFSDGDGDSFAAVQIVTLPGTGSLKLDGNPVSAGDVIPVAQIGNLVWTPAQDQAGTGLASLTFKVGDSSNATSATQTITFDVTPVADAPTAASSTIAVEEDGSHAFTAAEFGFGDVDGDTLASVTIATLPANGSLTLNGVAVTANQEITAADIANLKWTPAADANGTGLGEFTFTVKDSSGQQSASSYTIGFNVAPVADDPVTADKTITFNEDGSHTFSLDDFGFSDADGNSLQMIHVTQLPDNGKLTYLGVELTGAFDIAPSNLPNLVWTPAANAGGDGLASLKFTVQDSSFADSAEHTLTFNVTPVADAPTAANDTITLDEDGSHTFSAADFGFADFDSDTLASVIITALPANGSLTLNGVAVTANQEIAAADIAKLAWSPAADTHGDELASLAFMVKDSSGQASASAYTLTFDVTSVADKPTGASSSVAVQEDGSYSFQASDFGFADVDGDSFQGIVVSTLPANGALTLDGVAVTAGQQIAAADLTKLVWTPVANAHGDALASLSFSVLDGSTPPDNQSASAYTITFNVAGVADAPTAANATITLNEDATHTFSAADFGFADLDGDALASVTITALPANGSLTLNGVAVTANQEIAAADIAKLAWTPAANAHGDELASLAFTVKDSSGQASASAYTLTFDVNALADLPTASDKTVTIDEDASYSFTADDFGFADADGDSFAFITVTNLPGSGSLMLDGEEVQANQVIAAADLAGLVWTPAADANGDALGALSFTVTDSDGETSAEAKTITIDVNAVNDGPEAVNDKASLKEGKSVAVNVLGNDTDVDGDTLLVSDAKVTSGNGTVTINDAGKLVVTYDGPDLDPGKKATITVTYTASDGSATDGGVLKVNVTGVAEPGDDIIGTPKNDKLIGTNVGEKITGLAGKDTIRGNGGDDVISASSGNDKISGGDGNDRIGGGGGNDKIDGGNGNDIIGGWQGNDRLKGGAGADTFVFHRRDGSDTIVDFQANGKSHDMLDLEAVKEDLTFNQIQSSMSQDGKDVVLHLPHQTEVRIENVDLGSLTADHFIF